MRLKIWAEHVRLSRPRNLRKAAAEMRRSVEICIYCGKDKSEGCKRREMLALALRRAFFGQVRSLLGCFLSLTSNSPYLRGDHA